MKKKTLLAAVLFFFSVGLIKAEDKSLKENSLSFDQLLKAVEQKDLKNTKGQFHALILELDDADIKTISFKNSPLSLQKEFSKGGPGYFHGPYPPWVLDNSHYKYALKYPPQLQQHEHPVAQQLLVEWNSIEAIKGTLLNEAYALNSRDSGLYQELVLLQNEREALKQEIGKFNAEVVAYNQQCAGQPVNQYCTNWSNRIEAWRADLTKRVNIHNQKVESFNIRKKELDNTMFSFVEKIRSWSSKIDLFIEKAREFLKDYTCTKEEYEQLKQAVKTACKTPESQRSCSKAQDCDTLRNNVAKFQACINARVAINNRCHGGDDPGHKEAIKNELIGQKNCNDIIKEKCDPIPDPAFRFIKFN
ncbi:MAG: hypothetical protein HY746_00300 [Elusimicrobia bacterium]|nr:hypothetical protein [Elusimicrobiota bacterium]